MQSATATNSQFQTEKQWMMQEINIHDWVLGEVAPRGLHAAELRTGTRILCCIGALSCSVAGDDCVACVACFVDVESCFASVFGDTSGSLSSSEDDEPACKEIAV